ncbi:MAG: hypothetical protein PHZ00_02945 [Candidatus Peribacteraceae bacterium]|nr:hypothetical protein [Candidatus Peribacteraceae bacterium]
MENHFTEDLGEGEGVPKNVYDAIRRLSPEQQERFKELMRSIPQEEKTDVWEGEPGGELRSVGTRTEECGAI